MHQKVLSRFGALYARIKKWSFKFPSYGCRPADSRPTRIHKRGFRCIRKPSYVMLHIRADSKCHCWSILGGKVFRKAFHNPTESKTYEILPIRQPANSRPTAGSRNNKKRFQCITKPWYFVCGVLADDKWKYWLNLRSTSQKIPFTVIYKATYTSRRLDNAYSSTLFSFAFSRAHVMETFSP